jgi:hypothetical protein
VGKFKDVVPMVGKNGVGSGSGSGGGERGEGRLMKLPYPRTVYGAGSAGVVEGPGTVPAFAWGE